MVSKVTQILSSFRSELLVFDFIVCCEWCRYMYKIISMHEITNMITIIHLFTVSAARAKLFNNKKLPLFSIIELFHMVGKNQHLHRR